MSKRKRSKQYKYKVMVIEGPDGPIKVRAKSYTKTHKVSGSDTFDPYVRCRYKHQRGNRMRCKTEIKTRTLQEKGEPVKSEWGW